MAKVNERQLIVLFSETGPVEELMRFRAREVVALAQDNVREIMRDYQGDIEGLLDAIDFDIIVEAGEVEAVIGIRDDGPIARYLSDKEDREQVWLTPAVEQVFD